MDEKIDIVEHFFSHAVWIMEFSDSVRLIGITIKVEPSGYLAVMKGLRGDGPIVGFIGARSLVGLYRDIQAKAANGGIKWRPDQFALDKISPSR